MCGPLSQALPGAALEHPPSLLRCSSCAARRFAPDYSALLASPRRSLYEIAQEAGFATLAVAPAITMAWPEAESLGFQHVLAAGELGYAGEPYNWVTMPDQFTLARLEQRLARPRAQPIFAEVALISSHAPWVPIPPLIPWDSIGDGRAFNKWAEGEATPEEIWRDRDRVREQYRRAIDYSLRAVAEFAARQPVETAPLILLLGDHQPAPFVSLSESRDVPAHLIGPPELVAAVADWDWSDGLVPDGATPVWPMEALRDRFLGAFRASGEE